MRCVKKLGEWLCTHPLASSHFPDQAHSAAGYFKLDLRDAHARQEARARARAAEKERQECLMQAKQVVEWPNSLGSIAPQGWMLKCGSQHGPVAHLNLSDAPLFAPPTPGEAIARITTGSAFVPSHIRWWTVRGTRLYCFTHGYQADKWFAASPAERASADFDTSLEPLAGFPIDLTHYTVARAKTAEGAAVIALFPRSLLGEAERAALPSAAKMAKLHKSKSGSFTNLASLVVPGVVKQKSGGPSGGAAAGSGGDSPSGTRSPFGRRAGDQRSPPLSRESSRHGSEAGDIYRPDSYGSDGSDMRSWYLCGYTCKYKPDLPEPPTEEWFCALARICGDAAVAAPPHPAAAAATTTARPAAAASTASACASRSPLVPSSTTSPASQPTSRSHAPSASRPVPSRPTAASRDLASPEQTWGALSLGAEAERTGVAPPRNSLVTTVPIRANI